MSADFYQEMQDVATEVLDEFRQGTFLLTKKAAVETNPDEPWLPGVPEGEDVQYTMSATVRRVERKYVDGELIVGTEDQATLGVMGAPVAGGARVLVRPEVGDAVSTDGRPRTIKDVRQLPAAGTPVAWIVFMEG